MRITSSDYDGNPRAIIDITRDADGTLKANGHLVITIRPVGGRVMLIVDGGRQYFVEAAEYLALRQE